MFWNLLTCTTEQQNKLKVKFLEKIFLKSCVRVKWGGSTDFEVKIVCSFPGNAGM